MLRAASSMMAQALSSAGEVRNGSSRIICGVRWLQVKSAFGACALTPRPKGRGTSLDSVAITVCLALPLPFRTDEG
jgi:hypothetical protein